MLTVKDLRKSFINFFQERDHRIVPSSSLLPKDDPSLLFTTAGMVQFKPMFTGAIPLEYTRASTIQKCLRTSDLEQVGKTKRHLTFFEMLGNFSFGDYFKKEAIEFAWDYSTNVIKFPKEKLWISIFEKDDEAFDLWNKRIGIPDNKIIRLGKKDNFWGPAGETGACGPCSELYLDRGENYGCRSKDCKPGCDCERFLEYWNLVFVQYNKDIHDNFNPLPKTGIDTGMGLERLALLVQNADSIYETDEIKSLVNFVSMHTGTKYEKNNKIPLKVIVEHARALTFAMSDGVFPSNEGRGYVLRRILRRALRFTRQIGVSEPFIYKVVDPIVEIMGEFYPGIKDSSIHVKRVIESEEKRFLETLENGMDRLEEIMKSNEKSGSNTISGKDAFILYDTFGFPLEMTNEMAHEKEMNVDISEFEIEMNKQRERGKQSWKGGDSLPGIIFEDISKQIGETVFTGYEQNKGSSIIKFLYNDNVKVDRLSIGDKGILILDKTPFYGESGGQIGDTGSIKTGSGFIFKVNDTKKHNRITIHIGEVVKGEFKINDKVDTAIDIVKRNCIQANHSATHLLHSALKIVLGNHVKQAGSLVSEERFRFDFSHFSAMTQDEIYKVETIVNEKIWQNIPVKTEISKLEDAMRNGATALFDEKYDNEVRVIKMGDFSMELCGGTHVASTSEIGVFRIIKEASPGAGMRRIEALTLKGIYDRLSEQDEILTSLEKTLNITPDELVKKIHDIFEKNRSLEKEISKIKKGNLVADIGSIIEKGIDINGIKFISHLFTNMSIDQLREISDKIRSMEQNSVACLASEFEGKAILLCAATNNSVKQGVDCGKIIKNISGIIDGGGGGRKDMAQAGGKAPEFLGKALDEGINLAKKMIQ